MGLLSQKHFIGIEDYNAEDLQKIIDTGYIFREILERPIKKSSFPDWKEYCQSIF